ncbi:hypothetical protein GCM10023186_01510 [Hymenobacter koreensis]|uniref:Outer membrane protein beta-barrel domain-containing protein n=2 Tax=Hymenobacter koreensis TaxID=1084523 RepID=A0ABP8IU27_9BACT
MNGFSKLGMDLAYSPLKHVVLTGAGSFGLHSRTDNPYRTRYTTSLGGGLYTMVGKALYLSVLGSYGIAASRVSYNGYSALDTLPGQVLTEYRAAYRPYSGQLCLAFLGEGVSGGLLVRQTWLDVRRLTRNGGPVGGQATEYFEPALFLRFGRRAWQGHATLGFSSPNANMRLGLQREEQRYLAANTLMIGMGLVVRPHLLRKSFQ